MAMIKVTAGTTTRTFTEVVEDNTTIRSFVERHNLNTPGSTLQFDGEPIRDLDKTFAEVTPDDECMLFSVVNSKNA